MYNAAGLNSARFVDEVIAPRGWRGKVLVVIGGYIDGSNLHDGVDIIAVGGCAADTKAWPGWEEKWKELLTASGLGRWHHTDFMAKIYHPPGQPKRIKRN